MTTLKRRNRVKYSEEFKRQVIEDVLSGRLSAHGARLHYKISGTMTVYDWVKRHKAKFGILEVEYVTVKDQKKNKKGEHQEKEELQAELEALKRLLESERKRSEAYLTMIKLAEQRFQIPIEKKSGAKPSKK